MHNRPFKETARITGLLFRQLRLNILLWLIGFGVVVVGTLTAYPGTYPDEAAKKGFYVTVNNPAMEALVGKGYSLQDFLSATASLFAQETLLFTLIVVAAMNILLMTSMTRGDEEAGRTEFIRSLPVGRLAHLSASGIVITVVNMLLAVIIGLGLWATPVGGTDFASSLLYGMTLGALGLAFAGVTALVAQLSETARGTTMISFAVLAVAFLIRAIGDVGSDALSLFSPLGWGMRTNVFIDNHWWPVLASVAVGLVLIAGAFYLHRIRDLDAGLIAAKPGKQHASTFLTTPFGFAAVGQTMMIVIWVVFIAAFSLAFGYILNDLETYFADNPLLGKMLEGTSGVKDQFVTLLISLMSLISAIPTIMIVLALRKEETTHRIENILSKAVSRTKLMGSYVLLAVLTSIVLQAVVAVGLWGAGKAVMDQPLDAGEIFLAAFTYLAAIWVLVGLTLLLIGLVPKMANVIWLYLVYGFVIIFFGGLLDFPDWVNNLSVFETVPGMPADDFKTVPVVMVLAVSVLTGLAGFVGYNKRDIG